MNKDDKKNAKKTVTVKYKDPKKDSEAKTYELEIKDEEQTVDERKFKNVKSNIFRTTYQIYVGGKDDKSGNDWKTKFSLGILSWILIAVGVLTLIGGLYYLFFRKKRNKKEEEAL